MFSNIKIYVGWFHVIYVTTTLMSRLSRVGRTTTSTWNHNYVTAISAYWKQHQHRFSAIYAIYSTFQGRSQMSRFIPCHLRTVRTAWCTGQVNRIIDNHVLSGVNQLNQKLHAPVKLTTGIILAMTRKTRHLRHIFVVTETTWSVT